MRKPLIATAAAVAIAVLGAPTALAQDTAGPESEPEPVVTAPEEPASTPVDEPEPVEPPVEPTPIDDPPPPVVDPLPPTDDPPPLDDPPPPTTPHRQPATRGGPTSIDPPPIDPPPSTTAAPTTDPTSVPPTSTTTATSTGVNIVIDVHDGGDHSIHIDDDSKVTFEGDKYSNSYTYADETGRTRRGYDLDCVDFPDRAAAQAVLDNSVGDPFWLDADRDGRACEVDSGEFTKDSAARVGVRKGGQVGVYPAGSVDTGSGR